MYFVKARKFLEDQDAKEPQEKSRRDRYQRSDSARLLLQALSQQHQQTEESKVSKQVLSAEISRDTTATLSVDSRSDFKPEELPDGACYRPNKDLRSLQAVPTSATSSPEAARTGHKSNEFTRHAEYIGTFSVSGSDKGARERQMESQLEQMRTARDRMPVNLIISNSGVKVLHQENNNVFMEHSLKRIWYATCDPEYCQFSFLAREPKTSAEVQYCHAFVTQTSTQAEELISIIGEAFKSTDNEAKKPPTFHELIEQQVQQQQAKFRETEKEAQSALQQKLKEIATPTPFSERAQFRMEQRRKSEDVTLSAEQQKTWMKQQEKCGSNVAGNRRSEIPTRQSTPQSSPLKRNSVPPQAAILSNQMSSSPAPNPLSVLAIKESMETRNSNTKFKGSPVTALKNEIDKRLSVPNGEDLRTPIVIKERDIRKDLARPPKPMTNRPLPLPPNVSKSPQLLRRQIGGQQPLQQSQPSQLQHPQSQRQHPALQRHSLDDYHLPRSTSSQIPLSSNARGGVAMRNSPKRRQPRPMSEIATSSSGAAGVSGRGLDEQQRQTIFDNFPANFNLPTHTEVGAEGLYIYGANSAAQGNQLGNFSSPKVGGRHFPVEDPGRFGDREGGADLARFQASENIRPLDSNQAETRVSYPAMVSLASQVSRLTSGTDQDSGDVAVPRYQNDSPFQGDRQGDGPKHSGGFESLMCLDRSHIHDEALRNAAWYHAGLPREIALDILQQEEAGSFIVRDSTSHPGCYALSVRVPKFENASGISHYLILRTHRGVKLKGLDKEWTTLAALVTHHTVMRELLPCTLRLPKVKGQGSHPSPSQSRSGGGCNSNDDTLVIDSYSQA